MKKRISCDIAGVGAFGPGFSNWNELKNIFLGESQVAEQTAAPKPAVIPANERRRAPLLVKMAVEVSAQALEQSGIPSEQVACVFGSGIADTDLTDYMCRVLTTELKQLSPTKFHNSVHNAAVGYWTISTGCMKSSNSIAAFHETPAVCLLEAMLQCDQQQEPVLVTLFDTKAHAAFRGAFDCDVDFAAAVLICPRGYLDSTGALATLHLEELSHADLQISGLECRALHSAFEKNPAAKVLPLLEALCKYEKALPGSGVGIVKKLSANSSIKLKLD